MNKQKSACSSIMEHHTLATIEKVCISLLILLKMATIYMNPLVVNCEICVYFPDLLWMYNENY